jgi:cytosine deaminase
MQLQAKAFQMLSILADTVAPWLRKNLQSFHQCITPNCMAGIMRPMSYLLDYSALLSVALSEARKGLAEGGIPIGAAIFDGNGKLIGSGRNRRVQNSDPSVHGETDAFRNAGRQRSYRHLIMVTTLAPCWYCSGLVRQFGFRKVIVGESRNFRGGSDWLQSLGIEVIDLDSQECFELLANYIRENPAVWNEDIGEE